MNHGDDEHYMQRCMILAEQSMADGDLPFGALIVQGDDVVAEAKNTGRTDITGHAEVNAVKAVLRTMPHIDFSTCTLYTNFEPCAMCSFILRDVGIGRVVFAVASPHLGGYSRWNILTNTELSPKFTSRNASHAPLVTPGVLQDTAAMMFDQLEWEMHKYGE